MSDALPHTTATLKRLKERNLVPVTVLLLAAAAGALTGFTGVLSERGVNRVSKYRVSSLSSLTENKEILIPLMFIVSALPAMSGYWLVRRFSPESGGSGIPKLKAHYRMTSRSAGGGCAGEVYRRAGYSRLRYGAGA
ncbi:hypothetical protein ACISK3_11350 [Morganella morganii]